MLMLLMVRSSFAQQVIKVDTLREVIIRSTTLVNENVTKAFTKQFKDAVSARWFKLDKNYLVKFISNDQKNNALYNKKGYLVYHISYMNGNGLPKDIEGLINAKYVDFTVLTAIHVEQDTRSIWMVNLKAGQEFILARVEEGEVEEIDRFGEVSK